MAIKYTQLINSFVSTEGSGGFMTNYVYYTFLVVHTDGSVRIAEGKYGDIAHLLPYIRTPLDDIAELKETIKKLRKDISDIAESNMNYLVNSLFPIPDILNKNEAEAVDMLEKAGLQPGLSYQHLQSTPKNGIVWAFARNSDNFKVVDLKIVRDLPKINGCKVEDALELLKEAGFHAEITNKVVEGKENGIVLEYMHENEKDLCVKLVVSTAIPEITGRIEAEAKNLLEEAGYKVVTKKVLQEKTPGLVEGWTSVDQNTIQIDVGGTEAEGSFVTTDRGTIICSQCNTEQKSGRRVCWKCGVKFNI